MDYSKCAIYTSPNLAHAQFISLLSQYYNRNSIGEFIEIQDAIIGFDENEEHDTVLSCGREDGFLFFSTRLDIEFYLNDQKFAVDHVSRLLLYLWSLDFPAVASCDYEHLLPEMGGDKSYNVPWPKMV